MVRDNYPETVLEVLDDEITFTNELLRVVRLFAASNPWKESIKTRKRKFLDVNRMLAVACGIREPSLVFGHLNGSSSGLSHYVTRDHRIVIVGKLSVVTFLHEFAHALAFDERKACTWSINLFRHCFPRQFSRLIHIGHTLVRPQDISGRLSKGSVR